MKKKDITELGRRIECMRVVMSFIRSGGDLSRGAHYGGFADWVDTLEGISEDDKEMIIWTANNGKLEWEESAKKFLENR